MRTSHILLSALVVALLAGGLAAANLVGSAGAGDAVRFEIALAKSTTSPASEKKNLKVTGSVSGLHPGGVSSLPLELVNPNSFDIDLTSLEARVASAPSGCGASHLRIERHDGHLIVPAKSSAVRSLRIVLSAEAPDSCKNVQFSLEYSGIAVKA